MPVLSIVTPVYNSARFLEEALDSVAGLETPHEHIVIDGGSQDETVELLRAREDSSLVWVSEPDRDPRRSSASATTRPASPPVRSTSSSTRRLPSGSSGRVAPGSSC